MVGRRSHRRARRRGHRRRAPMRRRRRPRAADRRRAMTAVAAPGIALVGCPNCGKTALFNALTGGRQKVANYAGVTVERRAGQLATPAARRVQLLDLPGTYSLRARSPDEVVTRDVVLGRMD